MKKFEFWRMAVVIIILVGSTLIALPTFRIPGLSELVSDLNIRPLTLGLDLQGGMDLTYNVVPVGINDPDFKPLSPEEQIDLARRTKEVLIDRIDSIGVSQSTVQIQNSDQIRVQIPTQDTAQQLEIKEIISKTYFLSFHEVVDVQRSAAAIDGSQEGTVLFQGVESRSSNEKVRPEAGSWYLVKKQPVITGELLAWAGTGYDDLNNPIIEFEWGKEGADIFADYTEHNVGKRLAVILAGRVYTAPVIKSRIRDRGIIEGDFTVDEVSKLVKVLKVGSLPAELKPMAESIVGPTLGKDSIRSGVRASLGGALLVVIFMLTFYKLSGLYALIALLANVLLQVTVLVGLDATLTLPGIAGFALTVGMAVDANVLIFERIKEELRYGKPVRAAISAGYDKAFVAIFDANVTTILTGIVLFYFGTGPIRGFAVTLLVGLVINLFTALWVTRVFQDWQHSGKDVATMSI